MLKTYVYEKKPQHFKRNHQNHLKKQNGFDDIYERK